jgi:hypothetical protein
VSVHYNVNRAETAHIYHTPWNRQQGIIVVLATIGIRAANLNTLRAAGSDQFHDCVADAQEGRAMTAAHIHAIFVRNADKYNLQVTPRPCSAGKQAERKHLSRAAQ